MTARFLDLSAYNDVRDFAALKRDGIAFVVLKATEGATVVDARFYANSSDARVARMPIVPYHFLRAGNAEPQARHFLATAVPTWPEDPGLAVDFEPEGDSKPTADDLVAFLRALVRLAPPFPRRVYVNLSYATEQDLGAHPEIAEMADLWLAHWAASPGTIPLPWTRALWWQEGAGRETGVVGKVDEDVVLASGGDQGAEEHQPVDALGVAGGHHGNEPVSEVGGEPAQVVVDVDGSPKELHAPDSAPAPAAAQEGDPIVTLADSDIAIDSTPTPVTHGETL